jgi:hypothetical protein
MTLFEHEIWFTDRDEATPYLATGYVVADNWLLLTLNGGGHARVNLNHVLAWTVVPARGNYEVRPRG